MITSIVTLRIHPERLEEARAILASAVPETREFEGNRGVDVLVDRTDETRWLVYERWATMEHDAAYRAHRAGEGRITGLADVLAAAPVWQYFDHLADT
jgi:quinol monooxygenase YgiN